jgi:xanthine dehydrogenase accessory factor
MRDIIDPVAAWLEEGKGFAVARVVSTWGSSPRAVGAAMIIDQNGHFLGSVSGGCVEAAVVEEARDVLRRGVPTLVEYGVDDGSAWSVGLACGGRIRIYVEPVPDMQSPDRRLWSELVDCVRNDRAVALVTPIAPPGPTSVLEIESESPAAVTDGDDRTTSELATSALSARSSRLERIGDECFFIHVIPPRPLLVVIGANHIAVALVRLASSLGFRTTVVDPRGAFADNERFVVPPDRLISEWPQDALPSLPLGPDTFAVLLTHDPKIDDPATDVLLDTEVAYIGALGSRRTQDKRRFRLREKGHHEEAIDRIRGPVGLDIGARTPDEIALSILAEVVQVKNAARTLQGNASRTRPCLGMKRSVESPSVPGRISE